MGKWNNCRQILLKSCWKIKCKATLSNYNNNTIIDTFSVSPNNWNVFIMHKQQYTCARQFLTSLNSVATLKCNSSCQLHVTIAKAKVWRSFFEKYKRRFLLLSKTSELLSFSNLFQVSEIYNIQRSKFKLTGILRMSICRNNQKEKQQVINNLETTKFQGNTNK